MNVVMIATLVPMFFLAADQPVSRLPPVSTISQVGSVSGTRFLSAEEAWAHRKTELLDAMAATPSETTSIQGLAETCIPRHLENCRTYEGGYFSARGRRLYWQLQEGDADENAASAGFVFLTESAGILTPVFWAFEAHDYERPVLMWIGDDPEPVIAIGGTMAGSGHYDTDVILRWNTGQQTLVPIDNQSWGRHLHERLPEGLDVRKGLSFSYGESGRSVAEPGLWRPEDSDCCPSGGTAKLYFDIEGDVLVLREVEVRPPSEP